MNKNFIKTLLYKMRYIFPYNRENIIDKLCKDLKLNSEEFKLKINNKLIFINQPIEGDKELCSNIFVPIGDNNTPVTLFNYKLFNKRLRSRLGWFIENPRRKNKKGKQPVAIPSLTQNFKSEKILEFERLYTISVLQKSIDGGKFASGQKLYIYKDKSTLESADKILCEINVIDDYNDYKPNGKYIGIINDGSATGKFKLYLGNNKKLYNYLDDEIGWYVVTLVSDKRKNTTTVDWLHLIDETLPKFDIIIDMNSYIKNVELFVEVYNIIGIFKVNFFNTTIKIKNHEQS